MANFFDVVVFFYSSALPSQQLASFGVCVVQGGLVVKKEKNSHPPVLLNSQKKPENHLRILSRPAVLSLESKKDALQLLYSTNFFFSPVFAKKWTRTAGFMKKLKKFAWKFYGEA